MSGDGWNAMPGQPRRCAICGKPILIGRQTIEFKTSSPKRSVHVACKERPVRA